MNHNGYLVKWSRYVVDEVRDDKWEKVQVGNCILMLYTASKETDITCHKIKEVELYEID